LVLSGILRFLNTVVQFFPSIIVKNLLKTLKDEPLRFQDLYSWDGLRKSNLKAVYLSLLLFICLSLKTVIENQYFYVVTKLGMNIRGTLSAAIYQKALNLGLAGRQNTTVSFSVSSFCSF
jgi:hypothetical protein